jgi:serine/threonine protein kinase
MFAFACPRCGVLVRAPEHAAGKKVRCGSCGEVVDAPRAAALAASLVSAGPPATVEERRTLPTSDGPQSVGGELVDFLAPPQAPDELGRLGPYRVLGILGSGGMGVVFRAEDPHLHRPVALKAILPALAESAGARTRFLREARAAAAIDHDHVVTIYQVGEDRGIPYLAMPLLQGETMEARLLREKNLPVAEVVRIGREVAEGLAAAHACGLIHRDIKPGNIWLEQVAAPAPGRQSVGVSRVKLLDFGLALAAETDTRLTQSGAVVGTPGYLAPEQTRGGPPDPRSDLFSLGCVLYRACTGALPFQGRDALATLAALATETPRPARDLNPEVPPALSALVARLLAKDPAGRPASALAVVEALAAVETRRAPGPADARAVSPVPLPAPETPSTPGPVTATEEVLPARRLHPGCVVGAALAGLAGMAASALFVAGVAWLTWSRLTPPTAARAVPEQPFAAIRTGVQQLRFTEKDSKGGAFGRDHYQDVLPEGGLLIGFEVGIGKFTINDEIDYLRPIYLTAEGEKLGKGRGKTTDRMRIVKARPGYAVGALTVRGSAVLVGLSLTFRPIGRHGLRHEGSYQSDWIGGAWDGQEEVLDGDGAFVIGICGRTWAEGKPSSVGPVLYRPDPD